MNKKSLKMQREVIVIHPKMTVQELADAARKDVGGLQCLDLVRILFICQKP